MVYANWRMLGYSPAMDWRPVVVAGALQGLGLGALMPALTKAAFSTLDPKFRPEAPHSSTCRASMAARSVSRWSRSSFTTTPRPCTWRARQESHLLPRRRPCHGFNLQAGARRAQRHGHRPGDRHRSHRSVRDSGVRHADRQPACAVSPQAHPGAWRLRLSLMRSPGS